MGGKKRKRRAKEQRALQIFAVLNKWQKEGRRCSCSLGEEGERDGDGGGGGAVVAAGVGSRARARARVRVQHRLMVHQPKLSGNAASA